MAIRAPGAVALTWDDLQQMPEDGYRRELVHGQLLVTPSPTGRHQAAVTELVFLLRGACPKGLRVLVAPYDWRVAPDTVLEPDLMVVDERDFDPDGPFTGTPLLVVEVLSPSTADTDRTLKRLEYEQAGVAGYWLVDPVEPSMTVLARDGGSYREAARVVGDEPYEASSPFAVSVVPARLR